MEDEIDDIKKDLNRKRVERLFGPDIVKQMEVAQKLIADLNWQLIASPADSRNGQLLQSIYDILQNSYDNILNDELNWLITRPQNEINVSNNIETTLKIISFNCNGFKRNEQYQQLEQC